MINFIDSTLDPNSFDSQTQEISQFWEEKNSNPAWKDN